MAPIGSVLKNSIVYIIVVSVATFVVSGTFLLMDLSDYPIMQMVTIY